MMNFGEDGIDRDVKEGLERLKREIGRSRYNSVKERPDRSEDL
jgi:hypothetical protein